MPVKFLLQRAYAPTCLRLHQHLSHGRIHYQRFEVLFQDIVLVVRIVLGSLHFLVNVHVQRRQFLLYVLYDLLNLLDGGAVANHVYEFVQLVDDLRQDFVVRQFVGVHRRKHPLREEPQRRYPYVRRHVPSFHHIVMKHWASSRSCTTSLSMLRNVSRYSFRSSDCGREYPFSSL